MNSLLSYQPQIYDPYESFIAKGAMHWIPQVASTTFTGIGIPVPNATGTAAARTFDPTTYLSSCKRTQLTSTTSTANSVCHYRLASLNFAGKWGYRMHYRFITSDAATVSGAALFAGATVNGITAGDPSATASTFGFGNDTADTNYQIISHDGTTATKVNLGSSFPVNPATPDIYDVYLEVPVGSTTGTYTINRIDITTGAISATASGTKTGLPAITTALITQVWRCNRATTLTVAFDLLGASFTAKY